MKTNKKTIIKTKDLIILGFVLAFLVPLAGLIICIIGLNKLNKENSVNGKGLAIAGIIISAVLMVFSVLPLIGAIAYFGVLNPSGFVPA